MRSPVEELKNILNLEVSRGFDNKAVIGGLCSYLSKWLAKGEFNKVPQSIITAVSELQIAYDVADIDKRKLLISRTLKTIDPKWALPKDKQEKPEKPIRVPHKVIKVVSQGDTQQSAPTQPSGFQAGLEANLEVITGIGAKTAKLFSKLGVITIRDLLFFYPRRYDDYSNLLPISKVKPGEETTLSGTLERVFSRTISGGRFTLTEAMITDGTGSIKLNWFNQPWLKNSLKPGMHIFVSGKIDIFQNQYVMTSPDWEPVDSANLSTNRIVPVYSSTAGLSQKVIRKATFKLSKFWSSKIPETLGAIHRENYQLADIAQSLRSIHFPSSQNELSAAQYRLAFDELLLLQLGVVTQKQFSSSSLAKRLEVSEGWLQEKINALPYKLTTAQQKSVTAMRSDLSSGKPMNRLLQGDVGSGKTVVAALAISMAAQNLSQSAVLTPTGILAEQHFRSLHDLFVNTLHILTEDEISLLTGDTSTKVRRQILERISSGEIKLLIGTHALLQSDIVFKDLQLVVIDEQHRFGVEQRAALRERNQGVHLLVMTATPIPRSLAMTINGDLDLTLMDEMPIGRLPIKTRIVSPAKRDLAYAHIRKEVEAGHQAFIIYPLVEQGEREEVLAATEEKERLAKSIFPHFRLGLVHGRLSAKEKDDTMHQFRDKKLDILVSTSVVEVGVDIPNATVMLIEGANRFGLAQLHQFRGRVGRGEAQSCCILIPETDTAMENQRLQAMELTNDGFKLAEMDLAQRGPGDFLGTRQSGFSEMKLANLTNIRMIEKARELAEEIIKDDPTLTKAENKPLVQQLNRLWSKSSQIIN